MLFLNGGGMVGGGAAIWDEQNTLSVCGRDSTLLASSMSLYIDVRELNIRNQP